MEQCKLQEAIIGGPMPPPNAHRTPTVDVVGYLQDTLGGGSRSRGTPRPDSPQPETILGSKT